MKRFVIERELPKVGEMVGSRLQAAASTSNDALREMEGAVQWVQSFVASDKMFCVYLADDAAAVRKHAEISGFPANTITEVVRVIDPMTAAA